VTYLCRKGVVTVQESSHKPHFTHVIVRWPICRTHLVEHLLAKAFFNVRVLGQHVHRKSQQRCCLSTSLSNLNQKKRGGTKTYCIPSCHEKIDQFIFDNLWVLRVPRQMREQRQVFVIDYITPFRRFQFLSLVARTSRMRGSVKSSMTFLSGDILSFQNSASGHSSAKAERLAANNWPWPNAWAKMLEEWLVNVGGFLCSA
jgi:hypothetical protein